METDEEHEEENGSIILTPEFTQEQKCQPCTIIELISLFNDDRSGLQPFDDKSVVRMTKEYANTFNKYGLQENNASRAFNIRKIFTTEDDKFSKLETTLLVDLAPSTAEEAFNLIPSLKSKKINPAEMQRLLDTLNNEIRM